MVVKSFTVNENEFEKARKKPAGHKAYSRMTPKGKIAQVKEKPYDKKQLVSSSPGGKNQLFKLDNMFRVKNIPDGWRVIKTNYSIQLQPDEKGFSETELFILLTVGQDIAAGKDQGAHFKVIFMGIDGDMKILTEGNRNTENASKDIENAINDFLKPHQNQKETL